MIVSAHDMKMPYLGKCYWLSMIKRGNLVVMVMTATGRQKLVENSKNLHSSRLLLILAENPYAYPTIESMAHDGRAYLFLRAYKTCVSQA